MENLFVLVGGGFVSGILAGLLGIGGGFLIVSLLVALNYPPIQAISTSSLVIILSSTAGSLTNWRMGYLKWDKVIYIAVPAIILAPFGAYLATAIPTHVLLIAFGLFLLTNIFLIKLRQRLVAHNVAHNIDKNQKINPKIKPILAKTFTGSIAGFLAGLLGVGGGAIMVPLQMLLLNENIKVAIPTSLGVIVAATIASSISHALKGNVLFAEGIILGFGGILGTQVGTRVLPKLSDSLVSKIFIIFLATMAGFMFWKGWSAYQVLQLNYS